MVVVVSVASLVVVSTSGLVSSTLSLVVLVELSGRRDVETSS